MILLLLAFCFYFLIRPVINIQKAADQEIKEISNAQQLPEEITPEGVADLSKDNTPFLLINADIPYPENLASPGPARLIYFTTTPSYRSAQNRVSLDRQSKPTGFLDSMKLNSQRLMGTPVEWQRLNLTFLKSPYPTAPQFITPRQLSEAIKDGIDLQLIDFRPMTPGADDISPFPHALRWMPDETLNNLDKLSKEKWIVLVGFSNEWTQQLASQLFKKGYLLTVVLDGGYPAWVNATDR
jgi:rhodanese-related sulfurtransferase